MDETMRLLTRAERLLRGTADAEMRRHGVRVGQNRVLEALWETDGLTPGELAARLHITTPTVVNTATRMAAAGLVTRERDPDDARLVRLFLTERGLDARQPVEEAGRRVAERALAPLTGAERRHLHSALTKIVQRLGDDEPSRVRPVK